MCARACMCVCISVCVCVGMCVCVFVCLRTFVNEGGNIQLWEPSLLILISWNPLQAQGGHVGLVLPEVLLPNQNKNMGIYLY